MALSISAWSSFVGSLIATIGIVLFASLLAKWALSFGPAEYFALMCFAFACIAGLMGDAPVKAGLAAIIGLSMSCVGLDSNSGVYRFTGGDIHLSDGIQFVVVVIGVFSISELLLMLQEHHSSTGLVTQTGRMLFNWRELKATWWGTLRSSVVGFGVGVLPGAGATIASAMTYSMEKRLSDTEGTFGKGDIRGVAAPEAANNSVFIIIFFVFPLISQTQNAKDIVRKADEKLRGSSQMAEMKMTIGRPKMDQRDCHKKLVQRRRLCFNVHYRAGPG